MCDAAAKETAGNYLATIVNYNDLVSFFLLSCLFSDDAAASRTKRKFDIAYLIAKENMAFVKMVPCANLRKGTA